MTIQATCKTNIKSEEEIYPIGSIISLELGAAIDLHREGAIEIHKEFLFNVLKLDLICEGLIFGQSGFAEANRNMVSSLYSKNCNIKVHPHDDGVNADVLSTLNGKIINSLLETKFRKENKSVRIIMTIPLGIIRKKENYHIGYVMFETLEIPKVFIPHLMDNTDELWTPSNFNLKNFKEAGYTKPIFVMPFGVDTERFNPDKVEPMDICEKNKFVFLSIMGWSERKGISALVEAYLREFKSKDNTVLYLKGSWYDLNKAQYEINKLVSIFGKKDFPEIKLDFNLYNDDILPKLYKRADCFVLASRGEGWGLNYTEAMAMGLPTIGTRCSSQTDFMNDKNSFLIDVEGYETEPRCNWVSPEYIGGKFAIPSIGHLRKLMKKVYSNPKLSKKKGNQAREDMVNKYKWEFAADRWFKRLKDLEANL